MRIAFIINEFLPLSETFILNQITGLIDNGYEVDIYASRPNNQSKMHSDIEKYNLFERVYFWHMPKRFSLRLLKGAGLLFINFHKSPMILLSSLNFLKYGLEALSLKLVYAVIPFLDSQQYDIIHCQMGPNGITGVYLRDMGALKGKLITTFHGFDISKYLKRFGRHVYDSLFDKGDFFLTVSDRMKCLLINLGCDKRKIVVYRMGVDGRKFSFRPYRLCSDGVVRLVTIARLIEKKGVEYSIRAVAELAKSNKKVEYSIVGDGFLRRKLQRLVLKLDVAQIVKFIGWRQQEQIVEILNNSDILVAPSVTGKDGNQEGTPVVVMEAMAVGLPVVSTQHSGIPELVEDGKSGFLVPERDVDVLVEKIGYLIEHSEMWPELGKRGRKIFEEKHEIRNSNQQLVNIYQNLIKDRYGGN